MKQQSVKGKTIILATLAALLLPMSAMAFDSGSTGADGVFNPLVDTEVALPADGILNYTTVTIPSGVTVTFAKNTLNTPVTMLASGDITIDGNIHLNGTNSTAVGAIGDGNLGDDGLPGVGGPGGFDGGAGGIPPKGFGGNGLGPGGGQGGKAYSSYMCGGAGGGYAGQGGDAGYYGYRNTYCGTVSSGGPAYGSITLLPLIGGSGGGGGLAGAIFHGAGGGGGGGAILLASSGKITVNGHIYAKGGITGYTSTTFHDNGSGGGGAGGAIRLIATTIAGNGDINASGGGYQQNSSYVWDEMGGGGSAGRIRLEAETLTRTAATSPAYTLAATQGAIFVTGLPKLLISSVGGVDAPTTPTGSADIVLPEATANPVAIEFKTTGIPVGNTVELTLTPPYGAGTKVTSNALAGTKDAATASASIDLPDGPSVLAASVTFTVTEEQSVAFSAFTEGEKVATVSVKAKPGQGSMTTFTTVSGKQYTVPSSIAVM